MGRDRKKDRRSVSPDIRYPEENSKHYHSRKSDNAGSMHESKKSKSGLPVGTKDISDDDYYRLNAQFCLWLRKEKDRYIDELSSEKSRKYFHKFVVAWNDGKLKGYSGSKFGNRGERHIKDEYDLEDERDRERYNRRKKRLEEKDKNQLLLDEVAPRETGREAMLAKKRARNEYHRTENSIDMDLNPDQMLEDTSFKAMLKSREGRAGKRERERDQRKAIENARKQEKLREYESKNQSTIEMFRRMAEKSREEGLGLNARKD
ncbi:hypothetical protein H4219_001106 [Mycoemilia scoparia]|uniref:Uncharacterized protein n=1 Tax=Mycoemilia scoparia TaxID=417184 RepID=A0A9W8DW44_9FUNG|nr:hypothetical protein H4219_001106 [Mycoemilia scoparia]